MYTCALDVEESMHVHVSTVQGLLQIEDLGHPINSACCDCWN